MSVMLEELINDEGNFGDVYKGKDDLGRSVAVKIIRYANEMMSGALTHAKALARTNHPNVVTVYCVETVIDPKTNDKCDCIVMELINGETLESYLNNNNKLSDADTRRISTGIIDGIEHIHLQGMAHRDLHEQNVMISKESVKIIDILYHGTLAELSSSSKELRIREDNLQLRHIIGQIIMHSVNGDERLSSFHSNLPSSPSISDIRKGITLALEDNNQKILTVFSDKHDTYVDTVEFYDKRFSASFPGARGVVKFDDPAVVVDRLAILLAKPLALLRRDEEDFYPSLQVPIWWLRGNTNCAIQYFSIISPTEILIGCMELRISDAAIFCSNEYFRNFIYLHCDAQEQTGLYEYLEGEVQEQINLYGYMDEEYALFKGNKISRAEYDDGAAVINGKVVDTAGEAELRHRYITPFNLLIAPISSPINNSDFDSQFGKLMNGILKGDAVLDELVEAVGKLPRKGDYYD